MATLWTPPRLYLDTNHLIRLREIVTGSPVQCLPVEAEGYRSLLKVLRNGAATLAFCRAMAIEWADDPSNYRSDVARDLDGFAKVFESAKNVLEIECDNLTYKIEIIKQCRTIEPSIAIDDVAIIRPVEQWHHGMASLAGLDPAIPKLDRLHHTGERLRDGLADIAVIVRRSPEMARERTCGFREAAETMLTRISKRQFFTRNDILWWAEHQLDIVPILRRANPAVDGRKVLSQVDLSECPGVMLWMRLYWQYLKAKEPGKIHDNDADDYMQSHIPAYVDYMLTEKNLRSKLHQADPTLRTRVFSNITQFPSVLFS